MLLAEVAVAAEPLCFRSFKLRRRPQRSTMWELLLWFLAFGAIMARIGMSAYQLIALTDLESDYINPYDSSSRINAIVTPEFIVQGVLCAFFLLTMQWFPFLLMVPITYYHVKLFLSRKHLLDVTEIFRLLNGEKKYRLIKLAIYFSIFIIVIYRLVMTAVLLFMDEDDGTLDSGIF